MGEFQYIETMQSSSYKFTFVPKNQIGSFSNHRQHMTVWISIMIIHCRSYTNICCSKNLLYTGSHGVVSIRHNFVCNHRTKEMQIPCFQEFGMRKNKCSEGKFVWKTIFKLNIWRPQKERQWDQLRNNYSLVLVWRDYATFHIISDHFPIFSL